MPNPDAGDPMAKKSVWLRLMLAAVLGLLTGWWIWQRPLARDENEALPAETRSASAASLADLAPSPDERNNIDVYKAVSPAVVNITSTTIQYDFFFNVFPSQGSGSGFLIDDKGDILTNYHVISGARA